MDKKTLSVRPALSGVALCEAWKRAKDRNGLKKIPFVSFARSGRTDQAQN